MTTTSLAPSSQRIVLRRTGLAATFRDARVAESTGWLVETWIVHARRCRTESIGTVDVYLHGGAWHVWRSSLSASVRSVADRIAKARNA